MLKKHHRFGSFWKFWRASGTTTTTAAATPPPKPVPMAGTRFFLNTQPDYLEESGPVKVPDNLIHKFVQKILRDIEKSVKPTRENASDGLYLGTAGIAYMYFRLSSNPAMAPQKAVFLDRALEYVSSALLAVKQTPTDRKDVPSFVLGNCGVYAVAAAVYKAMGQQEQSEKMQRVYQEAGSTCGEPRFLNCGSDELFVGRAGYIMGALWMAKATGTELRTDDIYALCDVMYESGRTYAERGGHVSPLMYAYYDVEYLGAAHGLCSILQTFLCVPGYLENRQGHVDAIKGSVDYLLGLQDDDGNFPCATDEIGYPRNKLVHWCHGAGGVIYLMARAYLVWKEDKYLESCDKMADLVWRNGLLKKGPGICHGVAGNAFAFLLMHRLTQQPKHLHRALAFARFMENDEFTKDARTPDYPHSLYEGVAGTACFLGDLLDTDNAAFPFSDVFA